MCIQKNRDFMSAERDDDFHMNAGVCIRVGSGISELFSHCASVKIALFCPYVHEEFLFDALISI